MAGARYDLAALTRGNAVDSGVPGGRVLVAFADAVLGRDNAPLSLARTSLLNDLGEAALVEASAVVATFSMVDRVADATGIPLDGIIDMMTQDLRASIGVDQFPSARGAPRPGPTRRVAARMISTVAPVGLRMIGLARRHPRR